MSWLSKLFKRPAQESPAPTAAQVLLSDWTDDEALCDKEFTTLGRSFARSGEQYTVDGHPVPSLEQAFALVRSLKLRAK